ncbi:MAG: phage/plasmid replication protein, II/X family [Pseudomonas sp.]
MDYNRMFDLPSRADVRAWLRAGEFKCKSRHGRPVHDRGTLTFGKGSTHWRITCYCKADEINGKGTHKLAEESPLSLKLGVHRHQASCRVEILSKKLKALDLQYGYQLTPAVLWTQYRHFIGELDMSEQIELNSKQLLELPNKYRSTYVLWKQGHNLFDMLSRPTYYRHRKYFLDLGIDINIRCDRRDDTNVIPMIRVLEAKPAAIPSFFSRAWSCS